jgi:hypothetical protein
VSKHQTEEEISVPELIIKAQKYFQYLKKRQLVIWLWVASFFVLGVVFAITRDDEYEATNVVLSYSSSQNGAGTNQAASRLAGLAGITLPGAQQQGGRVISELMIPNLLTTYPVAQKLGSQPLRFYSEGVVMTGLEYFSAPPEKTIFDHIKNWTIEVPGRIINWVVTILSSEPQRILPPESIQVDSNDSADRPSTPNSSTQEVKNDHVFVDMKTNFALGNLTSRVLVSIDMNIISITATMPDAYAAADLARHATDILMQEVVDFEIRKTEEELAFLLDLYAESEAKYNNALDVLTQIQDRLRGITSTTASIELTRAQGNAEIARQQFQQITLRVEEARIKLKEDTPMFAVLNPIQIPQRPVQGSPVGLVVVFLFLGLILGVGWVTVRGMYDAMTAEVAEKAVA